MEKYFCNYNQSLALKKLGFDEPCFGYYDGWNGQTHLIVFDEENPRFLVRLLNLFKRKINQTYNQDYVEYLTGICSAPLKSQVFEWFREYRLSVVIEDYLDDYEVKIVEWTLSDDRITHEFPNRFETYEEAESACIDKLIEIVKDGR